MKVQTAAAAAPAAAPAEVPAEVIAEAPAGGVLVPLTNGSVIKLSVWLLLENPAPGTPKGVSFSYNANIFLVGGQADGIVRWGDTVAINNNTAQNASAVWSAQPDGRLEINRSQVGVWEHVIIQPTHKSQVLGQPVNFGDKASFHFSKSDKPGLLTANTRGILAVNTAALNAKGISNSNWKNGTQFRIQQVPLVSRKK